MKDSGERTKAQLVGKHAELIDGSRERLDELRRRQRTQCELKIDFDDAQLHDGKLLVRADGLNFEYAPGRPLWREPLALEIRSGERIRLTGDNGTGKSTFIRMLLGLEPPDAGTIDIGETVRFGYYAQQGLSFDENAKVIDVVSEIAEQIELGDGRRLSASQFLQHFLFPPQAQHDFVGKLSGGERRRLYLCTVLMRNPNFLVLDEPTNDLDIVTLQVLEEYLQGFGGCLIVVSHDRYFMNKVVDHLLVFEGEGSETFPGTTTNTSNGNSCATPSSGRGTTRKAGRSRSRNGPPATTSAASRSTKSASSSGWRRKFPNWRRARPNWSSRFAAGLCRSTS